ncbi:hypothetical protein HNY73_014468 [Argiope bruennichi]|uniref:Uncharacterized protein n=1 Tax=Argiope bruennichi TaxID=94029 RepID=A0A8T0EP19_ARGBR|nr:hypothetical protein HNY73_014468 [Argiope bruennichi]
MKHILTDDKFSAKSRVGITCDCGPNGVCGFKDDQPVCTCNTGFSVNKNKCEACDCGPNGVWQFSKTTIPVCTCNTGFSLNKNKCEALIVVQMEYVQFQRRPTCLYLQHRIFCE